MQHNTIASEAEKNNTRGLEAYNTAPKFRWVWWARIDEFSTGWNGVKWLQDGNGNLMVKVMTSEIPVLKLENTRLRTIPVWE